MASPSNFISRKYETTEQQEYKGRKTLVLCFDGTGNKFSGNDGDSNIIKIFSMLDREDLNQHVYYQPGIGTYSDTRSYSHTSRFSKIKSAYEKAKDSAVGTSFEKHVMSAYTFLMRYYRSGDDIYMFGFSRGAYTARFLAEMLDSVGLLAAGNEELLRFAWKTFASWQTRHEGSEEEKEKKEKTFIFMKRFRETFSIPVRRIRFLGLFDTVNSVPRFETAWMQRSKFPYTARSSAKVIRHAVSIDERRAKFRQDLLGQKKTEEGADGGGAHLHLSGPHVHVPHAHASNGSLSHHNDAARAPAAANSASGRFEPRDARRQTLALPLGQGLGQMGAASAPISVTTSATSLHSINSQTVAEDITEHAEQDIQEVWFPGCHADIGGGWPLLPGEETSISHPPLIWMIREARKAGLPFDEDALRTANYILDDAPVLKQQNPPIPTLEVEGEIIPPTPPATETLNATIDTSGSTSFRSKFLTAATKGRMHDVLALNNGATGASVLSWNIMEYLPFRRMDLRPDGSWKPIRWPLPMGETRDIPADAVIHSSALKRMEADSTYRPGNLIAGVGGRGVRRAPPHVGMGKWKVLREEGDLVGECFVRDLDDVVENGNGEKKGK